MKNNAFFHVFVCTIVKILTFAPELACQFVHIDFRSVMLPLYLRTSEIFKSYNSGGCVTASRCIACGCYYILNYR